MSSTPISHESEDSFSLNNGEVSQQSRMIASTLSNHMGLDSALQISTENQWYSVVAALNEMKSNQR